MRLDLYSSLSILSFKLAKASKSPSVAFSELEAATLAADRFTFSFPVP